MTWTYHLHPHDAVASVHMQFCTPTQIKLKNIVIYFDKLTWELKVQTKKSDILSMWMSWMTPRKEESVYRELTAADLATFCTGVKMNKKLKNNFFYKAHLIPKEFNVRILFPALPKHLNKRGDLKVVGKFLYLGIIWCNVHPTSLQCMCQLVMPVTRISISWNGEHFLWDIFLLKGGGAYLINLTIAINNPFRDSKD